MTKTKRIISILLAVIMLVCTVPMAVSAESYGGECGKNGDNVTWSLDTETGVLKIEGSGDMKSYSSDSTAPWERYWSKITTVEISDGITSIGHYAFYGCAKLTSITIPDGVTSVGVYAFSDCSSLTSITIPDSVTGIGHYAFYGCSSLTSITIPDSVTSISGYAFHGCSSLTSITIPDSVTRIGSHVFHGCSSLTSITIPDSVTSIGNDAFYGCSSLTNITIPDSVTSIEYDAFSGCSSLTDITIPDSVPNIARGTFDGCSSLTSITIPDSVTDIGINAFRDCSSLTSVTIPDSVRSIGSYAFYGCTKLTDVYYSGDEVDWNNIEIGSNNDCLTNATIHYGSVHEHSYTPKVTTPATCTTDGVMTYSCFCGAKYTEVIPVTGHSFTNYVSDNNATCTADGTKTAKCDNCDATDTVTDEGTATGHSFTNYVSDNNATCTADGTKTAKCDNCDATDTIVDVGSMKGHTYKEVVTPAACERDGLKVYICTCGDNYSEVIPAFGHSDSDNDNKCDTCGKQIATDPEPSKPDKDNCDCMCHKTGFVGLVWKIVLVFYKLFRTNKTCACGAVHY